MQCGGFYFEALDIVLQLFIIRIYRSKDLFRVEPATLPTGRIFR